MNYLLPCPGCGQKLTVSSAQAGQSLQCGCGRSIEVPAMRGLQNLEVIADAGRPQSTWTRRKGLVFLGSAIVVVAACFGGYLWSKMPGNANPEAIRAEVDALDPVSAFIHYQALRQTLPVESPIGQTILAPVKPVLQETFEHPHHQVLAPHELYRSMLQTKERESLAYWLPLLAGIAILGMLIALSALLVRGNSPRRSRNSRPVAA